MYVYVYKRAGLKERNTYKTYKGCVPKFTVSTEKL